MLAGLFWKVLFTNRALVFRPRPSYAIGPSPRFGIFFCSTSKFFRTGQVRESRSLQFLLLLLLHLLHLHLLLLPTSSLPARPGPELHAASSACCDAIAPNAVSQTECRIGCQTECQKFWQIECQNECQNTCQIDRLPEKNIRKNARTYIRKKARRNARRNVNVDAG